MSFDEPRHINQFRHMTHLLLSGAHQEFLEKFARTDLTLQPDLLDHVATWSTEQSVHDLHEAHPDHWVPLALRVQHMIYEAWDARGDDLARDTDREALEAHARILHQAFPLAQKAYELSRHAYAFDVWSTCFMALVRDPQPLIDVFEDYCAHNEPDIDAIISVVLGVRSKWCAFSREEWLDWTDELRGRFKGPLPLFTLVEAQIRIELHDFYHEEFWHIYVDEHDEILDDFRRIKFATQLYPAWRDKALNMLAYELWRAGAYRQAHEALELCEGRILKNPWEGRFRDKQEVLEKVRLPWWKFWVR